MSYRKVKHMAIQANSERNLVLRQQCSVQMIKHFKNSKIILNIDETWLGMSDFRKMKWRVKGTTNSVNTLQINPRISMIVGIDTLGNLYCSLTQSNSNATVMRVFFIDLVRTLDKERPNWRNTTIVLIDNAPYHSAKASLKLFEQLKIPVMFLGPHSYDAAPCELFFAKFKSVDINPRHFATGKM